MASDESDDWKDYRSTPGEMWEIYRWVWLALVGQETKKRVPRLLIAALAGSGCSMFMPWLLGRVFDHVKAASSWSLLVLPFIALVAVNKVREWFHYQEACTRELMLGSLMGEVEDSTNRLFFEKSLGQHLREENALSVDTVNKGRDRVWQALNAILFEALTMVCVVIASVIALWTISRLAGCMITSLILVQILWSRFLNDRVMQGAVPLEKQFRAWFRYRNERTERAERVKVNGKEGEECDHLQTWFKSLLAKDRGIWLWFIRQQSWRNVVGIDIKYAILALTILGVYRGNGSIGLIYTISIWVTFVVDNLIRFGEIERQLNWCLAPIRSMKKALTTEPEIRDAPTPVILDKGSPIRVEFRNVSYAYKDAEGRSHPVLRDVSFLIKDGQRLAIIGKSGSGKSTLMRSLQRGMDPDAGAIMVNGHDLREIKLASWLALTGYIAQQPSVFDGTIRSNLVYGLSAEDRKHACDDDLWSLLQRLQLAQGSRLLHGLDTIVGRHGVRLSGGEGQRVCIGSALAKRPKFILADEATSSLDSTTERHAQEVFDLAFDAGATSVVIAHRLSTVRRLDSFIVLRRLDETPAGESQIEAIGSSFEELYACSPTFRQLADDQDIRIGHVADIPIPDATCVTHAASASSA